jgi:hypothetical protein
MNKQFTEGTVQEPTLQRQLAFSQGFTGSEVLIVLRVAAVNSYILVRFEVFTAVTMKNVFFWEVTTCGSC